MKGLCASTVRLARRLPTPLTRSALLYPAQSSSRLSSLRSLPSTTRRNFRKHLEDAKRDYPIALPVAAVLAAGSLTLLGYLIYNDWKNVKPQFAAYPEAVERQLRLALHFTHMSPDPEAAASYFNEALKAASECAMNPYSKEVVGIRIRLAEMLEKFGHATAAVTCLEDIAANCEKKLGDSSIPALPPLNDEEAVPPVTRQALLRWVIETKVKVASLYESDYLQNRSKAKETLSDAVGLLMKESKDPQTNGFTADNAAGMSMMEIASILSQMGDLYATSGEEANAVQTYMLALQPLRAACDGTRSCKEVQLFSNIASTMDIAMKKPGAKINGKPLTQQSLAAARKATLKWADQAIATAELIPPESRDSVCELGLISAQMTRADLLLDSGDKQQSKEAFSSLLPVLRTKGLKTLSKVAEDGLKKAST